VHFHVFRTFHTFIASHTFQQSSKCICNAFQCIAMIFATSDHANTICFDRTRYTSHFTCFHFSLICNTLQSFWHPFLSKYGLFQLISLSQFILFHLVSLLLSLCLSQVRFSYSTIPFCLHYSFVTILHCSPVLCPSPLFFPIVYCSYNTFPLSFHCPIVPFYCPIVIYCTLFLLVYTYTVDSSL